MGHHNECFYNRTYLCYNRNRLGRQVYSVRTDLPHNLEGKYMKQLPHEEHIWRFLHMVMDDMVLLAVLSL